MARAQPLPHFAPPPASIVPGQAEARASIEASQGREAEIVREIQDAERARRVAAADRQELVARIAAGEALPPASISAATEAIAGAEANVAILQDALRSAEAATKRADRALSEVLRAQLRRRHAAVRAASDKALVVFLREQERHSRLDVMTAEIMRAVGNSGTPRAELERLLGLSSEAALAGETAA